MNVLVGVSGTPRDDLPVSSLPTGRSRLRVRGQLHRRGGEQTWDEAKRHWIRPSVGTLSPQVVVGLCLLRDLFPSSHLARNTISERNLLTCWCRPRKEDPVMLQVTLLILSVHWSVEERLGWPGVSSRDTGRRRMTNRRTMLSVSFRRRLPTGGVNPYFSGREPSTGSTWDLFSWVTRPRLFNRRPG